ncbi:hypothetical protein H4218_000542 [Coemansia sp. IMI 209128]|nr:hypothetical protein H4218_000542 [Coemansia sp. IMI 209128]
MVGNTVDLDNPTPEQRAQAISDLRAKLSAEENDYCSDLDIWRFSVARQLDADKSAAMFKEWYLWRKSSGIDDLPVAQATNQYPVPYPIRGYSSVADANLTAGVMVKEYQLKVNKYFGGGCWHKRDKDGHPVYIERIGRYQIKDIPRKCSMGELFEYHYLMQEFLSRTVFPECTQLAGRDVSQQVVIFDLAGISIGMLSHIPALNMLREMLAKDQLYYPECMFKTYVVNAPSMFVTAWKLIRGWLDPRVISKIHILGKDHSEELLKQIPAHSLPSFLGGSCRCSHMAGGCVPSIPMNNYPDLPRKAYVNLRHQVQVSYAEPRHSYTCDVAPVDSDQRSPWGSPLSSPQTLQSYATWFGFKKDSPRLTPDPTDMPHVRTRYMYLRFMADRGRGMVVEVLWKPFGAATAAGIYAQDEEVLIYPETLVDPQRAPVLLELKVPNRAGQLVCNWRIASFDEGQAPFPGPEEAQIPIVLEYSIDSEDDLLEEFQLQPIKRE